MMTGHRNVMCTALILVINVLTYCLGIGRGWQKKTTSVNLKQPEKKNSEAEENCSLYCRRDGDCSQAFGQPDNVLIVLENLWQVTFSMEAGRQPVSDVRHLLLILIHITAEDDKGQSLQQQCSLLLLQLFAGDESGSILVMLPIKYLEKRLILL